MGFLEKVYLGNTLQNWLIALCIMVVAFAVLKIIHRVAISRLSKLAATDGYSNRRPSGQYAQTNQIFNSTYCLRLSSVLCDYAETFHYGIMAESSHSDLNFTGRILGQRRHLFRAWPDASKTDGSGCVQRHNHSFARFCSAPDLVDRLFCCWFWII